MTLPLKSKEDIMRGLYESDASSSDIATIGIQIDIRDSLMRIVNALETANLIAGNPIHNLAGK